MKETGDDSASHVLPPGREADLLSELGHRGERPLSVLDLIERQTFDLELAAWLMARISRGTSFIVGARPGGVGKSTIMRALLDLVPGNLPFAIARPGAIAALDGHPHCVVSHELSDHRLPAYLWGQDLRDFIALAEKGHLLAANLHADDLDEARAQIVEANGVSEAQFRRIGLFLFIRLEGDRASGRRVIDRIHYSDGARPHQVAFTDADGLTAGAPREAAGEESCRAFLEQALAVPERTVEAVRRNFLAWEKGNSGSP